MGHAVHLTAPPCVGPTSGSPTQLKDFYFGILQILLDLETNNLFLIQFILVLSNLLHFKILFLDSLITCTHHG